MPIDICTHICYNRIANRKEAFADHRPERIDIMMINEAKLEELKALYWSVTQDIEDTAFRSELAKLEDVICENSKTKYGELEAIAEPGSELDNLLSFFNCSAALEYEMLGFIKGFLYAKTLLG